MHIGMDYCYYYLYNKCNTIDLVLKKKKGQTTHKTNKNDVAISWICRIWLIMKLWKYN